MRNPTLFLSAILLFATPALAQSPDLSAIRTYYEQGLKQNGILGSSLAIVRDGKILLRDNYGVQSQSPSTPVDDNTAFHWASCTKTLTGIAILQLRDRGLLSLDEPLIKYIPELAAIHDPYGPTSAITIRQAMSHSAGFRDPTWPWRPDGGPADQSDTPWQPFEPTQWSQIAAMLPYTAIAFPPGSKFSYSNLGVVFLGEIIERLSGDPYAVYMEKNILRPLGMSRSYYDKSPYHLLPYRSHSWDLVHGKLTEDPFDFNTGITRSNGGLNAPIGDMVKYLNFLLGDPNQPALSSAVLKPSSLEEMWTPLLPVQVNDDFQSRPGAHDQVASSFFIHTDGQLKLIGHAGWQNGFRSHFYLDPTTHTAYIVAYNTDAQDPAPSGSAPNSSPAQNTRTFDFHLRDYLIDHLFHH